MSGIVSYGAYIPRYKIETTEIASVWGQDGSAMARNLNVFSKSVRCDCRWSEEHGDAGADNAFVALGTAIPEFATLLLPIASVILIVGWNYRRRRALEEHDD